MAEALLQQTRVDQAVPYYERFLRAFPTVRALARAPLSRVLKVWEGAGYYARARHLHEAARIVMERHHGTLPRSVEELEELPGIGPYMARAIASQAFGVPVLGIDANVLRVASRLYRVEQDPTRSAVRRGIERELAPEIPGENPGGFAQALMELGETICLPRHPECSRCPLAFRCRAFREVPDPGRLPVASALRRARPVRPVAALALEHRGRWLLYERPRHGLLGGLWGFPETPVPAGTTPLSAARKEASRLLPHEGHRLRYVGTLRHVYSHFVSEIWIYRGASTAPRAVGEGHEWVPSPKVQRLPLPRVAQHIWSLVAQDSLPG